MDTLEEILSGMVTEGWYMAADGDVYSFGNFALVETHTERERLAEWAGLSVEDFDAMVPAAFWLVTEDSYGGVVIREFASYHDADKAWLRLRDEYDEYLAASCEGCGGTH